MNKSVCFKCSTTFFGQCLPLGLLLLLLASLSACSLAPNTKNKSIKTPKKAKTTTQATKNTNPTKTIPQNNNATNAKTKPNVDKPPVSEDAQKANKTLNGQENAPQVVSTVGYSVAQRLQGYSWFFTQIEGQAAQIYKESPWLSFNFKNGITGSTGCQKIMGSYQLQLQQNNNQSNPFAGQINIKTQLDGNICNNKISQNKAIVVALNQAKSMQIINKRELVLFNADAVPVVRAVIKY